MKKLLVIMIVVSMSMVVLVGCTNVEESASVSTIDEMSNENIDSDTTGNETENVVLEVSPELVVNEEILPEVPAKMELGEDEIVVPQQVTMEQIRQKIEEIKVTGVEYEEEINKENIAGLLVMNCSYIDADDLDTLVNQYFESDEDMLCCFDNYCNYLSGDDGLYGTGTSVLPEKLLFDPYLINQAELIGYYIVLYQNEDENTKKYYDILVEYLFFDNNEVFTFGCNDPRCEGLTLECLQIIVSGKIYDGITEYNVELRTEGKLIEQEVAFRENVRGILAQ